MNSPEETTKQEAGKKIPVTETLQKLKSKVSDIFAKDGKEKVAEEYLEEQVQIDPRVTDKPSRASTKSKLQILNEAIKNSLAGGGATKIEPSQIQTAAKEAVSDLSSNSEGSQKTFFTKLSIGTQATLTAGNTLPFARYIEKAAQEVFGASKKEGDRKLRVAFEIFAGENVLNAEGLEIMLSIIDSVQGSYGLSDDFVAELLPLFEQYSLTDAQRDRLYQEIMSHRKQEVEVPEKRDEDIFKDLVSEKEQLLTRFADPALRAQVDVFLLSLTPANIRELLKSIPNKLNYVDRLYGQKPNVMREQLWNSENTEASLKYIEGLFQAAEARLDGGQKAQLRQHKEAVTRYIISVRNEYFMRKKQTWPLYTTGGADEFTEWINSLDDDLAVTTIAMSMSNEHMFREYFRGKVAQMLRDEPEKLAEFIQKAQTKQVFHVGHEDLFEKVFRELQQANLFSIGNDAKRGRIYGYIESNIKSMKEKPIIKQGMSLGGVDVTFSYLQKKEVSDMGMELTSYEVLHESSLAYTTATFLNYMGDLKEVSRTIGDFVTSVESGDKAEAIVDAAGKINTGLMDFMGNVSPIIRHAETAYLRIIRDKLAANNNQLPPDMFAKKDYIKNVMDKELEFHVKAAFPQMTDIEKDVYLKLGKALAYTSGEFEALLANALPPMTAMLKSANVPERILRKLESGEPLKLQEMKMLAQTIIPEFRDFPFRSLLMGMNPLRWLFTWIKTDEYGLFQLGFNPTKPGEQAISWEENIKRTNAIMRASFLGLNEEAVPYFDGKYNIPFFQLSKWTQKISLEKRGGIRLAVLDVVRQDVQEVTIGNRHYLDGMATLEKLMHKSPMLAYRFIANNTGPNGMEVAWVDENKKAITDWKEQATKKLFDYMHAYYPTFFLGLEQPHFFRQYELSFGQRVRQSIIENLSSHKGDKSGYWLFLSEKEAQQSGNKMLELNDPTSLGVKADLQLSASRGVHERLNSVLREAELYVQRQMVSNKSVKSLAEFFISEDPKNVNPELFQAMSKILASRIGWHGLEATPEQLFPVVQQYAREVFYDEKRSIYHNAVFLGNAQLSKAVSKKVAKYGGWHEDEEDLAKGGKRRFTVADLEEVRGKSLEITRYYQKLLKDGLIDNPFNWTYLNEASFNFQGTGTSMIKRNIGDYKTILDVTNYFMSLTNSLSEAVSQPHKSQEIIEKAFSGLEGKLWAVKGSHGLHLSAEMGWTMASYLLYPFLPSRARDVALAGDMGAKGLGTWARFFNPNDRWGYLVWGADKRKKVMDTWLDNPITKHILMPFKSNKKTTGFKFDEWAEDMQKASHGHEPGKVKKALGKALEEKMPESIKRWFGRKTEDIFTKEHEANGKAFTVDNFKKLTKLEDWWVGGEKNFGIGYSVIMRVVLIGLLFLLFQSFKEGLKSAEVK